MAAKFKLLIVDDDSDALIQLERWLEDQGFQTATAWGRYEAISLSEKTNFDLILLDERLATADACSFVEELARRQPRAVIISTYSREQRPPKQRLSKPPSVCKWEHADVITRVQRSLAS